MSDHVHGHGQGARRRPPPIGLGPRDHRHHPGGRGCRGGSCRAAWPCWRILWLLARADREVGALSSLNGATASATSQHLAKLRFAGLVSMRKQGRLHVYSARGAHVRALVDEALYYADHRVSGELDQE